MKRIRIVLTVAFIAFTVLMTTNVFAASSTTVAKQSSASENVKAIQAALDKAKGGNYTTVKLSRGATYEINGMLKIYSNTTLDLNGATLKRVYTGAGDSNPMLITYIPNGNGKYSHASNIVVKGGVWDSNSYGKNQKSCVMHFIHSQGITVDGTTIKNCGASHAIIFDGVKNAKVLNTLFKNCVAYKDKSQEERFVNEAIHIDVCSDSKAAGSAEPFDKTPCENITVNKCTFDNVVTGAGAHKHTDRNYEQKGIVISNNTFKKVEEDCVNAVMTTGIKVVGNTAKSCGAMLFVRIHGTTGFTISNNTVDNIKCFAWSYTDGYIKKASSGTLSQNTITNAGFKDGSTEVAALQLSNGNKMIVNANTISTTKYPSVQLYGTPNSTVSNNKLKNAYTAGTGFKYALKILDGSGGTAVRNNTIENQKGGGLYVRKSNYMTIAQNTIYPASSGFYPIYMQSSSNDSITGNVFQGTNQGVQMDNASKNNSMSGNGKGSSGSGSTRMLVKDTDGKWKVFKNGKVDTAYNDLAKNSYGWHKVKKGVFDPGYNGVAKNQYGWFYVKKGKVDLSYTGLARRPENGRWYLLKKGKIDWGANTIWKNQYGWHKVTKGEVDLKFYGVAKRVENGRWYYLRKGKIDWSYSGTAKDSNGNVYKVVKGEAKRK